jgi:hypothetical protein
MAMLNPTSKNALSFLLCICLFFNKISDKRERDPPETEAGGKGGEMTLTMYAHNI